MNLLTGKRLKLAQANVQYNFIHSIYMTRDSYTLITHIIYTVAPESANGNVNEKLLSISTAVTSLIRSIISSNHHISRSNESLSM